MAIKPNLLGISLSTLVVCASGVSAAESLFATSDNCLACHNGLTTAAGRDVSIGSNWRPSMMANAARDPYWHAAVRRETLDHPQARAAIEHECSACHMPMTRYHAKIAGKKGQVFANLVDGVRHTAKGALADDGVSCAVCHQITAKGLGTPASFTAGFHVDTTRRTGQRQIFAPYKVKRGLADMMRSAASFEPEKSLHVQRSELCASCHTLFTHAIGVKGEHGPFPEQVPYLEWKHSAFRDKKSCQSCHMPTVAAETPIASVLGAPRAGFSRHVFRGGNFFMPRMLNRYRTEQGVVAEPQELLAVSQSAVAHLKSQAARVQVAGLRVEGGKLVADIAVSNKAGHKLPTAYPSRRVWLHVVVRDGAGEVFFESGAVTPEGNIVGNDNDADPSRYEPHYTLIDSKEKVQIYEAIIVDEADKVTTGLLRGVRYIKDNRVLPSGFDKASAGAAVAVHGAAAKDGDFAAPGDRVSYSVAIDMAKGPFQIVAELVYQPIGYRWAFNLGHVKSAETARFFRYFRSMSASSFVVLAQTRASFTPPVQSPARDTPTRVDL